MHSSSIISLIKAGGLGFLLFLSLTVMAQEPAPDGAEKSQKDGRYGTIWYGQSTSVTGLILSEQENGNLIVMSKNGTPTRVPFYMVTKVQYRRSKKPPRERKKKHFSFTETEIALTDGTMLSEQMMDSLIDDSVSVRMVDGAIMRLSLNDVIMHRPKGYWRFKDQGYYFTFQWGLNWTKDAQWDEVYPDGMSLHFINGWKYNKKFGIGIGTGIDSYGATAVVPVYANLQYWPLRGRVMPVFQAGYGESFAWSNGWGVRETKGGRILHSGIGLQVNGPRNAFLLQVNYREQIIRQWRDAGRWWGAGEEEEKRKHRNIVVTVGMTF